MLVSRFTDEGKSTTRLAVGSCQVQVYSGRGSSQVRTKADKGQGQGAGQEVSPAGVHQQFGVGLNVLKII